jgi:hypothetical protein
MNSLQATLGPLLSPDEVRLTDSDRQAAHAKVDSAVRQRGMSPLQAADRHELVGAAQTRGELQYVLKDVHDSVPPISLTRTLRVASVVWLLTCVVQFAVWLALAAFGHLDAPWWLWSDLGLGGAVAILWWTHESYHRRAHVPALA